MNKLQCPHSRDSFMRKIANLEREAEAGIISEKKLAAEKKKIARQQSAIDKAQALFNIAINTAVAVTKVAPNPVLIALVLALGVLSAAAVLAEPVPAYEKGTMSSLAGPAVVGEKGPELRQDPSGKLSLTPGKPTLTNLEKGTKIYPADITNELLKYSYVASAMPDSSDTEILMMMGELKGIKQAIKGKPVSNVSLTPAGILTATTRGNTTIKKMDKFFK